MHRDKNIITKKNQQQIISIPIRFYYLIYYNNCNLRLIRTDIFTVDKNENQNQIKPFYF